MACHASYIHTSVKWHWGQYGWFILFKNLCKFFQPCSHMHMYSLVDMPICLHQIHVSISDVISLMHIFPDHHHHYLIILCASSPVLETRWLHVYHSIISPPPPYRLAECYVYSMKTQGRKLSIQKIVSSSVAFCVWRMGIVKGGLFPPCLRALFFSVFGENMGTCAFINKIIIYTYL